MSVAIVMGSASDLDVMRPAAEVLGELGIEHEVRVLSAHRTPDDALAFAREAADRGVQALIAGAGGAAHLAGVLAAVTPLPVIAVPVNAGNLGGLDALLAMVQMPAGIPVATVAINGARNAGLLAARIVALTDPKVAEAHAALRSSMADKVRAADAKVRAEFGG